jgi:hypothetical protein
MLRDKSRGKKVGTNLRRARKIAGENRNIESKQIHTATTTLQIPNIPQELRIPHRTKK